MPIITEEPAVSPDMYEFVNWDNADPPANVIMTGPHEDMDANSSSVNQTHVLDSGEPLALSQSGNAEALLFENPDADDFSFWAIEHYAQANNITAPDAGATLNVSPSTNHSPDGASAAATDAIAAATPAAADVSGPSVSPFSKDGVRPTELQIPPEPCDHCKQGGYQCKKIQEGGYKGYCTSCVALRCECSFGLASGPVPTETSFPANPWPTLGDHPLLIPYDQDIHLSHNQPAADPPQPSGQGSPKLSSDIQPKLGARFSRESVRILKNWVSTHSRHPYPTEEEKESLQRLTGLNKTQISNWLANARRRGKIPTTRSTSPHVRSAWSGNAGQHNGAIDIPQPRRSGTPSPFERHTQQTENIPLQRWANSPPEHEPASVTDIARAITSSSDVASSGLNSPYSYNFTDDGSGRSLFNGSSASSVGNTSQSSGTGSFASAFSHASHGSSFSSLGRGRRRRRRRAAPHAGDGKDIGNVEPFSKAGGIKGRSGPTPLTAPLKTYQCTFCTDTFKTKHDWQRHEKSLHLSLERWVCAPQGPIMVHPESKQGVCVFCGQPDPDENHIESHNFSACQERAVGDRTFYRKDHLRQHLKLVHDVKFLDWPMSQWKVATPQIRSRCGFCGIVMDTWTFRIDHLADHFKTGRTMAEWKGGWGFDDPVMEMVENSIPPYLIHDERNSPLPFCATTISPGTPRDAFELLRDELSYWYRNRCEDGSKPTDSELLVEACRIVFAAEMQAETNNRSPSWLCDLLMSDDECVKRARLEPIRSASDSRMSTMRINGKETVFDDCPLETALHAFVRSQAAFGLTAMDSELQKEACRLIQKLETEIQKGSGVIPPERAAMENSVVEFILRLARKSTKWLSAFRQRAHLPRSEAISDSSRRPLDDPNSIDATIHNDCRLETELAEFVRSQREAGMPLPDDATLQRQARIIIYEHDDGWNQTIADNTKWLGSFKERHMPRGDFRGPGPCNPADSTENTHGYLKPTVFFLNDTNCYRRLARELTSYVTSTMSQYNHNCHVPSDEELQHQARWILYDDGDPWNQTAADNAEWLMRFKRDVGLLPAKDGPGLPIASASWNISQGGTGFAPPYCFPKTPMGPITSLTCEDVCGSNGEVVQLHDGQTGRSMPFGLTPATANNFIQTFTTRYEKPAVVFCSRELENGLTDFVRTAVVDHNEPFPDDAVLRAKAREIMSSSPRLETPADDPELLRKFKDMARAKIEEEKQQQQQQQQPTSQTIPEVSMALDTNMDSSVNLSPDNMDFDFNLSSMTQEDIDNMLEDLSFDLDGGASLNV